MTVKARRISKGRLRLQIIALRGYIPPFVYYSHTSINTLRRAKSASARAKYLVKNINWD